MSTVVKEGSNQTHGAARGQARRATTESRILDGALALLAKRGAERVSMRAVARRANITAGAIYRHFASKRELLARAIEEAFVGFEAHLWRRIAPQPVGSLERLVTLGRAYLEFAETNPEQFKVLYGSLASPRRELDGIPGRGGYDVLRQCVLEAMRASTLRDADPDEVALFLWTRVHGLVMLFLVVDPREISARVGYEVSPATLFDCTRHLWLEGLAPAVASGSGQARAGER